MTMDELARACAAIENYAINHELYLASHDETSRDDVMAVVRMARYLWVHDQEGAQKMAKVGGGR